jgi:hypothetical protein
VSQSIYLARGSYWLAFRRLLCGKCAISLSSLGRIGTGFVAGAVMGGDITDAIFRSASVVTMAWRRVSIALCFIRSEFFLLPPPKLWYSVSHLRSEFVLCSYDSFWTS